MKTLSILVLIFLSLFNCDTDKNNLKSTPNKHTIQEGIVKSSIDSTQHFSKDTIPKNTIQTSINNVYHIPKALTINTYLSKKCKSIYECRIEPFYPIGWSNTGNFAYVIEPDTEAAGAYVFKILIKDSTNTIVWNWKFSQLDQKEWKDENIETIWKKNSKLFNKKLNAFGIIQDTLHLKKLPFTLNNKVYIVNLEQDVTKNKFFDTDEIRKTTISFTTKNKELNTVYSKSFKESEMIIYTEIVGITLSPTTKAFALINTNTRRGWEGPPHIISVEPILGTFK